MLENRKDLLNCINICLGISTTYLLSTKFISTFSWQVCTTNIVNVDVVINSFLRLKGHSLSLSPTPSSFLMELHATLNATILYYTFIYFTCTHCNRLKFSREQSFTYMQNTLFLSDLKSDIFFCICK